MALLILTAAGFIFSRGTGQQDAFDQQAPAVLVVESVTATAPPAAPTATGLPTLTRVPADTPSPINTATSTLPPETTSTSTNTATSTNTPIPNNTPSPSLVNMGPAGECVPSSVPANSSIVLTMGVSGGGRWTTPEQAYGAIGDSSPVFKINDLAIPPASKGSGGAPLNSNGRSEAQFHGEVNQWGFSGAGQVTLEPGVYEVVGEWRGAPDGEWVYYCTLTVGNPDTGTSDPTLTAVPTVSPAAAIMVVHLGACMPDAVPTNSLIVFETGMSTGNSTTAEQASADLGDAYVVFTANGQPVAPASTESVGIPLNEQGRTIEPQFHGQYGWGYNAYGQITLEPGVYEIVGEWGGAITGADYCTLTVTE